MKIRYALLSAALLLGLQACSSYAPPVKPDQVLAAQQQLSRLSADPTMDLPAVKKAYLEHARLKTLAACTERGIRLPQDFLAWIDGDPLIQATVYGFRQDPLPILLGLRSLEIDLGEDAVRRHYPQLALAFAVNGSHRGWKSEPAMQNDSRELLPYVGPDLSSRDPLELRIPGDPRVWVDTKDPKRPLDKNDHIINFLEDHPEITVERKVQLPGPLVYDERGIAVRQEGVVKLEKITRKLIAADVLASKSLQREFNAYMKSKGFAVAIDCGERVVHWDSTNEVPERQERKIRKAFEMFRDAYRAKGRLPLARDPAATPAEAMAWLIRNDRQPLPPLAGASRQWPLYPLTAPWPTLMMLADDDQPLREREQIWLKFRDSGEAQTYGEYIDDVAQQFDMQSARRLSPFAFDYGTIQMMWKDGGVCGTMASMGARTYRITGIPAATAGQPGHCALVRWHFDAKTGRYSCQGDQYAGDGDEATHVHYNWNYDEADEQRSMVYHQSVAWAVNHGQQSYLDAMICLQLSRRSADEAQALKLLDAGLDANPYAAALALEGLKRLKGEAAAAFLARLEARLDAAAKLPGAPDTRLYRHTLKNPRDQE
ncbi:MAG: hypothetical protein RL095_1839 [Verrucomicrobiota bacterium]|jgi:hypothetical protein